MSRVIQNVASVRFEINARQASATMEALRGKADELKSHIATVEKQIADLGNVAPDHQGLLSYRQQLKGLKSDLNDVNKTIKDYTRGVKAADELLKAAEVGNMESLSMKAIKAGQNGLKKRIENIQPDTLNAEELKAYRIIKQVIEEADGVVNKFKTDAAGVIQTLRDGGTVSERAMKQARDGVKSLMESYEEGSKENREFAEQYEFLAAKVIEFGEAQRRAAGEIVNADDARREAVRLTKEGVEASKREAEQQQTIIDNTKQQIHANEQLRQQQQQGIDQTQQQIKANQQQEDSLRYKLSLMKEEGFYLDKNGELVRNDINARINELEKEKESTRQNAEQQQAAAQIAQNAANQKREVFEQTSQAVEQLDGEVKQLREDLRKMGEEPVKPKVDTSNVDELKAKIENLKTQLSQKNDEWLENARIMYPHKMHDSYEDFFEETSKRARLGATFKDPHKFISDMRERKREMAKRLVGDEILVSPAYSDRAEIAKSGFEMGDARLGDEYFFGAKEAKAIIAGEEAYEAACKKVEDAIKKAHERLREAFESGLQPEQVKTISSQLGELENIYIGLTDLTSQNGYSFMGSGKDIITDIFGGDLDKKLATIESNMKRAETIALKTKDEFYEKTYAKEIEEAKQRRIQISQEEDALKKELADTETKLAEATKQGTAATNEEFEADQKKVELTEQLTQKEQQLGEMKDKRNKQEKEYQQAQDEADKKQQQANETQTKAIQLEQQHTDATKEANDADREREQQMQQMDQQANKLSADNEKLTATLQQQQQQQQATDRAIAEGHQTIADAEKKKAQAGELSAKQMHDAIAALEEENRVIGESNPKWTENNRLIGQYTQRLEEMKQRSQELRGEVMSLDDALKMSSNLEEGASIEKIEQALEVLGNAKRKATDPADVEKYGAAIDTLNEKLKESTGEWMKLADAEKLAEQAGENYYLDNSKKGFYASPEEIQKATAALNRQRETLIKTIQTKKANGDATKEEEKKLADLTKKLKDLKFEQDNLNMSQEKMRMLMKQPTEAVSLDELRAAIKRADGELKRMEGSLGKNSKEYKNFAAEVKKAKNVLKEMEGQAKATSSAWDKAWSRLKTYVGMYMGFNMLWNKMTGTMDDMMTLSDKMGEVRKTTGFTADEVGRLSDNLAKLDTRTNLTGLMEFSSLAGSIGLKTQEAVQGFTESANMIAVSLPEMGNEASRTLMKIADATGDLEKNGGNVRETLERVGSTIIALRANSAAAAGPITDFVSRVGAVGAQAGISIDQIAALGATVDALGGRVEMSATALSRMIPAIRNNTFEVAKAIGMTEKELKGKTGMEQMVAVFKALNKSVKQFDMTTEKGMNGAADAVENLLSKAGPNMQEVMKELNQQGARAGIVFGLLSQNVDKLEGQLDTASEAYKKNMALLDEYNKMNDTTAARWERMKNQIEEMFVSDNMQHWLGLLIKGLREVVDLISMDGPIGDFFRFSLIYFALWKAKWAEAMGTALISLGQFLVGTKASTAASVADAAAKTAEAAATEGVAVANEKAAVATGKFGKALKANLIGLAVTAVVFLGMKLLDMSRNAKKAATELDTLAKAEKRAADESVNERAKLEQLYKVTQDQNRSMEERRKALHDMVGDAKYKEYQEDLLTESNLASTAAKAYGELATQIVKAAKARVYQEEIEKLAQENLKLEDANEEAEKYVKDKKSSYERVSQNVATTPVAAGMFGTTAAAAQTHNDGQRQFLREYEQKQQDIIDNQEKIKKNNETIGKFEQKLKDTGVKLGGEEGDGNGGGGGGGGTNPYGDYDKVKSAYSEWNGNDLVARRKEMLERVKALANGADVQAVLSEDAKFISDAVRKNIKTTEQAIEWYNTERLKIQDALHAKHLTNTGDWLDPKKGAKRASRVVQDEMKYYMDELDAYYTERKAKIQEAQNDEEISEAEARNRTLANEAEWRQRRAELQQLYANKSVKVAQAEQDAIFDILSDRTGESIKYIRQDIAQTVKFIEDVGKKSKAAMDRINGDLDKGTEQDFLRQRNAIGQHMKDITAIVNKENPYAGITEELRKNLGTMDALLTEIKNDEERTVDKEIERTMFILEQSTKGYSLTWEELMGEMAKRGWKAWADAIEGDSQTQQRLMHQVYRVFEKVQDAIKKEASEMKKQADIMWSNILLPGGDGKTTIKDAFEQAIGALGIQEGRVSRANSLIGAGQASERVADKLAIQQMKVQLAMQRYQYDLVRKIGKEKIDMLRKEAAEAEALNDKEKARSIRMQAQNAEMALNLATRKEQTEELKMQEQIIARTEESEARLYKELREWGDLIASSLQSVMEASNAGNAEYYNELAKLNLTGKGGPGAGTYIVIDNAGTEDAKAHYEYLDERAALERQHEIEQHNAIKEAWKKLFDDLNQKMNEQITDWVNSLAQNASIDANTAELGHLKVELGNQQMKIDDNVVELVNNTDAMNNLTGAVNGLAETISGNGSSDTLVETNGVPIALKESEQAEGQQGLYAQMAMPEEDQNPFAQYAEWNNMYTDTILNNQKKVQKSAQQTDKQMSSSAQSAFAKMISAANMYGIAYQAMSNDNLSTTQKFEMMAVQAAGQSAISMLTVDFAAMNGEAAVNSASVLGKLWAQLGYWAIPVYALFTGLLGGLMGLAVSKIAKSKSEIAQASGASIGAGKLSTGMLTYAEGNVNEFTDPNSLTPGRSYNVDAADGRTYRAKYTGRNPSTHLTNGPEFHLSGEKGREMIIDADTTRQITMNEAGIWNAIKTLSSGGHMRRSATRRRGVKAFAEGNVEDFAEDTEMNAGMEGMSFGMNEEQMDAFQSSLDKNNELLERALTEGFKASFDVYGKGGLIDSYDTGKKTVTRHGERY